jgi:hypothetical protein
MHIFIMISPCWANRLYILETSILMTYEENMYDLNEANRHSIAALPSDSDLLNFRNDGMM